MIGEAVKIEKVPPPEEESGRSPYKRDFNLF